MNHHIKALMYLISGGRHGSSNVPQSVMDMMRKGLKAVSSTDTETTMMTLSKVTESFDVDDLEQTIRYHLFKLVSEYKYPKIPFLNYVSFLLPRRVGKELIDQSKDLFNQFSGIVSSDVAINEDQDVADLVFGTESDFDLIAELQVEELTFLTEQEFQLMLDIVERRPLEEIMKEYQFERIGDLQQFVRSLAAKIKNLVNARMVMSEYNTNSKPLL